MALGIHTESGVPLTEDGAWCWFQDPRAIRYTGNVDRTYTGWVTRAGDIEVASYDHRTHEITTTTLHPNFEEDDHDAPSVYVSDTGHLLVFYTAHGGPALHYRQSTDPENISSFEPEQTIEPSSEHTYPNPRLLNGRLFLFYRNENGSLAYVTSDDDGCTWSAERELITTDGRDWCVYFKLSAVSDGAIDAGLTFAHGGEHNPHRDLRHVRFDGWTLRGVDGAVIGHVGDGSPVTFWETPIVYDSETSGNDAWVWDCAVTDGTPEIVYAALPSPREHAYRYARWTGEEWLDVRLADAGSYIVEGNDETYYSCGITLDHERSGVCYLSVGDHEGSEILRTETDDDGETWVSTVIENDTVQNVRPVVPRNRSDDLPVLWMRGSYTYYANREYDTGIIIRNNDESD